MRLRRALASLVAPLVVVSPGLLLVLEPWRPATLEDTDDAGVGAGFVLLPLFYALCVWLSWAIGNRLLRLGHSRLPAFSLRAAAWTALLGVPLTIVPCFLTPGTSWTDRALTFIALVASAAGLSFPAAAVWRLIAGSGTTIESAVTDA